MKRILLASLVCLITACLGAGYFYHVGRIASAGIAGMTCDTLVIEISDLDGNGPLTVEQVEQAVGKDLIGHRLADTDIEEIESRIDSLGEVVSCEVFYDGKSLKASVGQRKAALKFVTESGLAYYSDASGYLFPLRTQVDVQTLCGRIPLRIGEDFKGYLSDSDERLWLSGALSFASYLDCHDYWNRLADTLAIGPGGELTYVPKVGGIRFLMGDFGSIDEKFEKITYYYKAIAPLEKAAHYRNVNLKYKGQIICK